jgi:hypothetical protein
MREQSTFPTTRAALANSDTITPLVLPILWLVELPQYEQRPPLLNRGRDLMAGMGGKLPLVDGANGRDGLAAVSPMLKRRREPTRFGNAELHGYVIATSTKHELKAIWAGRADLQTFQRRL